MTPILTSDDFSSALSQPKALLFLYVDWAIHARKSQVHINKVIAAWQGGHSEEHVPVYAIDVSEQSGVLWDALGLWLAKEGCPADSLMFSGAGPIILLRSGHVVMHMIAPVQYDVSTLKAACQSAFKDG